MDAQKNMKAAFEAVKAGMPVRQACREHGVARSTLRDKIAGKFPLTKTPKTALTEEEEATFSKWAINMARSGFGRTGSNFLSNIQDYLNQLREPCLRFKHNNKPGRSWYYDYLARHPELTERRAQVLGFERAFISSTKIEEWFESLKTFVDETDPSLLTEPARWYNCDESGFSLCLKTRKVLAPKSCKGDRHLYLNSSSTKSQITTLCCMSAVGHFHPPLIVMPGKRLLVNPSEHFKECSVGLSESGWMTGELFCNWLENVFVPGLKERRVKRPVILFLDGSSTHKSKQASEICLKNGIILYCLQANATHLLQPLDLSFFGSLKHHWGDAVMDFQTQNPGLSVTKASFALVFKAAYTKSCRAELARVGFEKAGLFPLCKDAVLNTKKMQACSMPCAPPTATKAPSSSSSLTSLPPSTPHFSPSLSLSPSLATKWLVLENIMTEDIREKFERRMEEGYDLLDDPFYNCWKKCKLSVGQFPAPSPSSQVCSTSALLDIIWPLSISTALLLILLPYHPPLQAALRPLVVTFLQPLVVTFLLPLVVTFLLPLVVTFLQSLVVIVLRPQPPEHPLLCLLPGKNCFLILLLLFLCHLHVFLLLVWMTSFYLQLLRCQRRRGEGLKFYPIWR